ncbi:MAG: 2-oxoacid:acceptor oxidoreductase subunit alpha [Planctomycetota bacterium]
MGVDTTQPKPPQVEEIEEVVIRFAGDSGDGIQLTGDRFTTEAALVGNDLATLPDYPAEIRAPAGTLPGVSGYQLRFSSLDIMTPGDQPDVLVVMNPAALKVNLADLPKGGVIIVNTDSFSSNNLKKAGYGEKNPLEDGSLDAFRVLPIELTRLTRDALEETTLTPKEKDRSKNFFALGVLFWLYNRPLENTYQWIGEKFKKLPEVAKANRLALKGGWAYGQATEIFQHTYKVAPAPLEPGLYRNIIGNTALALGLIAAGQKSKLPVFYGTYPITPASDVLHALSRYKNYGVMTFQAEDEIAAIAATIGAAFTGNLAVTCTSGPGMVLKGEAMGLALMVELPLVICDVQRGGPSTGLPTKTEQADLLMAMYGRHGESPMPIVSASTPADCFNAAFEAARIALKYMTPVICLTDGYLANGSEPWKVPAADDLPDISVPFCTEPQGFLPYSRDPKTLARPWAIPGAAGLEHRVGGLEKADQTGNVSYDPDNHQLMIDLRRAKVERIADEIPPAEVEGPESGKLLIVGWGSTYGAIAGVRRDLERKGDSSIAHLHLRHLNPFPKNLGEVLARYEKVLVPELNCGQLVKLLRDRFLVPAVGLNKVQGKPFKKVEILNKVQEMLES